MSNPTGKRPYGWWNTTVTELNRLLAIDLRQAPSFRADVRIDFDEYGRVIGAKLLNPARPVVEGDNQ